VRTAVLNRVHGMSITVQTGIQLAQNQCRDYSKYFWVKSLETAVGFISLLFHHVEVGKVLKQNLF